jgi:hypothetical protein
LESTVTYEKTEVRFGRLGSTTKSCICPLAAGHALVKRQCTVPILSHRQTANRQSVKEDVNRNLPTSGTAKKIVKSGEYIAEQFFTWDFTYNESCHARDDAVTPELHDIFVMALLDNPRLLYMSSWTVNNQFIMVRKLLDIHSVTGLKSLIYS